MGFVEAVRTCLRKYVVFTGRARRSEFWFFELFVLLVNGLVLVVPFFNALQATSAPLQTTSAPPSRADLVMALLAILGLLTILALLLPHLAASVRRLHDTDRSGWWYFIILVPFGAFVLLILYCLPGTTGPNRFGPDPLDPSGALSGTFD